MEQKITILNLIVQKIKRIRRVTILFAGIIVSSIGLYLCLSSVNYYIDKISLTTFYMRNDIYHYHTFYIKDKEKENELKFIMIRRSKELYSYSLDIKEYAFISGALSVIIIVLFIMIFSIKITIHPNPS